jgi:hypothetical protein
MKGVKRFGVKGKLSPRYIASLHRTISHSGEAYNCGIQVRVTTMIGRSSQHLLCISAKEVLEGTRGCCITRSGTPEHPIKILDQKSRVTRRKTIKFFKI